MCVSDVDSAGVGVAEGGSAALRCGTLGEDPLLLPLHRTLLCVCVCVCVCVCEHALTCVCVCVCVSDVDGAGVGVAEGGSAALRCGTLGEDPLLLPLHRTHLGQPEGPLEDHAQAQAGVTHTHLFYHVLTHVPQTVLKALCSSLNVCSVRAALLSSFLCTHRFQQ